MAATLRAKAIAEGAFMAAITAMLAVAGLYIPFIQVLVFLVWTIPIILVIVRHGMTAGLISTAVAGLIVLILAGPLRAFLAVIQFGGLALTYGYAFQRRWPAGTILLAGSVVMVLSTLVLYYLIFLVTGINTLDIAAELQAAIDPTIELYKNLGMINPEQGLTEEAVREVLAQTIAVFTLLLPAMFIVAGAASAFLNYFAAQKILARFKVEISHFPPFHQWRLPWWTVWGFILGLGCNMAGNYLSHTTLSKTGLNIMAVYAPVFIILGLSVLVWLIHKYLKGERIYRLLLFFLIFLFLPLAVRLLLILGLLDLLFNYRRLRREN